MKKVPYDLLCVQLEALYSYPIDPKNDKEVADHCEMIARFIEDAGWSIDEFTQESLKDFLPPDISKMN